MINVDLITNKIKKICNLNFQKVLIHLYISLVISGSGSGKTNALLNLINLILKISVIETFFGIFKWYEWFMQKHFQPDKIRQYCIW